MSFLGTVTNNLSRAEQLRNAWNSLSYDIITQHNIMSPPLTPESATSAGLAVTSRLSPSSSEAQQMTSSVFEFNDTNSVTHSSRAGSAANVPLPLPHTTFHHTVRIKELHPSSMDPYSNYVHVRGLPSNEQCSCCPYPPPPAVPTSLYNGAPHHMNSKSSSACMQHTNSRGGGGGGGSLLPTDIVIPNNERLSSHFLNSTGARSLYPSFNGSTSPLNSSNENVNVLDNSDSSNTLIIDESSGKDTINSNTKNLISSSSPLKRKLIDSSIDSSSFPKQKKMLNEDSDEVACQVHGILSLPGCREPRYNITVSELQRRVNQPECLTKVDMISYVRLAKNSARSLLDKHGIKTNQHNQRSEHTVLSKMCESEAQVLAKGIREINYRYFPGTWFAKKSVQEIAKNTTSLRQQHEALSERLKDNEITRCVLLDIYLGLERRKEDEQMRVFNGISHSFGVPNMQNHILFLLSYIEEELRVIRNI